MTLGEIKALLVSADPDIRHHYSTSGDAEYTCWEETRRLPLLSDDRHEEAWRFYVHRFTRWDDDPIPDRLMAALDADDRVSVSHTVDYDAEDGWIHHIFECEGY